MSNQQQKCSICQIHPEDILMLQCSHDLCVNCAAQTFQKIDKRNHRSNLFTCEICATQTVLDKQTVAFLQNTIAQNLRKTSHQQMRNQKIPPLPRQKVAYQPFKSECIQHKQQVAYYCFDCHLSDICPECILSETHKNHHVNTLKKALFTFNSNIETDLRQKQVLRGKVTNQKKKLLQTHNTFKSEIEIKKSQIKGFFENLIKNIQKCESRLIKQLFQLTEKTQNSLKSHISRCDSKIQQIQQQISRLSNFLNSKNSKNIFKYKSNYIEIHQKAYQTNINAQNSQILNSIDLYKSDISEEIIILLNKIQIKRPNLSSTKSKNQNIEIQNHVHMHQPYHQDNQRSLKKSSYMEGTPNKPQMKKSLNLASDIINKLQSRQKNFE